MTKINELIKYNKDLSNYLKYIIPEKEIDDIIQNTYTKLILLENQKKLNYKNLKSLLFKIAKNDALQYYKKNKKNIIISELLIDLIDEPEFDYTEFFIFIENSNDLNLQILKDQCNGMKIIDMSEKYDLSISAIKNRLFQTKKKLKTKYLNI